MVVNVILLFSVFSIHIFFTSGYGPVRFIPRITNSIDKSLATKALQSKNETMVVSALSVKHSLCKLATMAEDNAKNELLSALGFNNDSQLETCYLPVKGVLKMARETSLILLNKLYFNYSMDLDPLFIANASELHGVQVDKVGFDTPKTARSFINHWVDQATYRRIQDLLDVNDVTRETSVVIVNAAHFKTTWQEPFSAKSTKMEKFRTMENTILQVPMMTQEGEFMYYESTDDKLKLVTMYLSDQGLSFTIVVPSSPDGLPTLLAKMAKDPGFISKIRNQASHNLISIKLPRFKVKTTVDWRNLLQQVGVKQIFNRSTSGLDAILRTKKTNEAIFLSKIKQKNFIEVDEYGIYRAQGNEESGLHMPNARFGDVVPSQNIEEVSGDRPFLFTINLHGIKLTSSKNMQGPGSPGRKITDELLTGVYYGPE